MVQLKELYSDLLDTRIRAGKVFAAIIAYLLIYPVTFVLVLCSLGDIFFQDQIVKGVFEVVLTLMAIYAGQSLVRLLGWIESLEDDIRQTAQQTICNDPTHQILAQEIYKLSTELQKKRDEMTKKSQDR